MVKLSIAITSDFYGSRQEDGSKQEIRSAESFSWIESKHLKFELEHPSPLSSKTIKTKKTNQKPSNPINIRKHKKETIII